jgi:2-methylcitrate dehydratase PrpD
MSFALEFAKRVLAFNYENLPAEAVRWAKIGILDTVGVTVAGSRDESTRMVEAIVVPGSSGPSLLFGMDRRVSPLDAGLINGTAAHALDFDDCNNTVCGHPSAPVLPGLFALADQAGASGRDFLTAYVAGFEAECKFSRGVNLHQYVKGWHPTVTVGIFGAVAAAGHLLKLNAEQLSRALGVAASMAGGLKSNLGTMTKPLHVGLCSRNAVMAVLLARGGFTSSPQAFEHKHGYFNLFNGDGNFDIAKIFEGWGEKYDIVDPGIAIKQYPCCGSTHPAADAALALIAEHKIDLDKIGKIESFTHARRLEHTNRPDPRSAVDAKFSVQYVVSRALAERRIVAEQFEGDAYRDPAVRKLMQRVVAAPYTTAQFPADNHYGAEVRVTLADGTVLSKKVDQADGRTSANPLPSEKLKAKFEHCLNGIVHSANVPALYAAIQDFEKIPDVRSLTALISRDKAVAAAVA